METNYLYDFLAVVDSGSFSLAADALYSTPSSVSKHIAALEKDLGVRLFNRTTRRLELSEYGDHFVPVARSIIHAQEGFETGIKLAQEKGNKELFIAAIPVISQWSIEEFIISFMKDYPGIQLHIEEAQPFNIGSVVAKRNFDLVICGAPMSGLEWREIRSSPLVAVFPEGHPLATRRRIDIGLLRGMPLLLHDEGTHLYSACVNLCEKAGFSPNVVHKSQRPLNLLQGVNYGLGVALMVRTVAEYYNMKHICCVDIEPEYLFRIGLAWDGKRTQKPITNKLIQYLTALVL